MESVSRIPQLMGTTFDDARAWFIAMRDADLLFHPEDDAAHIVHISSGLPMFAPAEAAEANEILACLFAALGDGVIEACYPVFMQACGFVDQEEGG